MIKEILLSLIVHLALGILLFLNWNEQRALNSILAPAESYSQILWIPSKKQKPQLSSTFRKGLKSEQKTTLIPSQQSSSNSGASSGELTAEVQYFQLLVQKISDALHYPKALQSQGVQGSLRLKLEINTSGKLVKAQIIKSSNSEILDRLAISAAEEASPFPPPPDSLRTQESSMSRLTFDLPIEFQIN